MMGKHTEDSLQRFSSSDRSSSSNPTTSCFLGDPRTSRRKRPASGAKYAYKEGTTTPDSFQAKTFGSRNVLSC